jgi:hypothetical protein
MDGEKVFESMFLKFSYFLKHKALPQKAVLLKHSTIFHHKYVDTSTQKMNDSIQTP